MWTVARSTLTVDQATLVRPGANATAYLDETSPVDLSVAPTGEIDVLFGGSGFTVTPPSTVFVGTALDQVRSAVEIPMPAITLTELRVSSGALGPGAGSFIYTVQKNGVDTGLTVTLTGSGTSGSVASTIAFNAGDKFVVKIVTTGTVETYHTFSVKLA